MLKWIVKQTLIRWLRERALVLPSKKRQEIADALKVDVALVAAIEQAIREVILQEVSR